MDYLETLKFIDKERFGVTGRSGGGAYSWWISVLDERIKASAPVAGIADLQNHVYAGFPNSGRLAHGVVEGHCDWQGTTEYNLALGERRASAVKQYLIALGINAQRISVSSQGDLLAVENGGNSNMAKDRKARFILDKG